MYQLKNAIHQVFAQYLETEFSDLRLVLCRWVTYSIPVSICLSVRNNAPFQTASFIKLTPQRWATMESGKAARVPETLVGGAKEWV